MSRCEYGDREARDVWKRQGETEVRQEEAEGT